MLPKSFVYVLVTILLLTLPPLFVVPRIKRVKISRVGGKFIVADRDHDYDSSGLVKVIILFLERPSERGVTHRFSFPPGHESIEEIRKIREGDIIELCPIKRAPGSPDTLESRLAVKRLVPRH